MCKFSIDGLNTKAKEIRNMTHNRNTRVPLFQGQSPASSSVRWISYFR